MGLSKKLNANAIQNMHYFMQFVETVEKSNAIWDAEWTKKPINLDHLAFL